MRVPILWIALWVFTSVAYAQNDQIPAFPGAEGFGKYTTGGRGGKVYIVTNLNDSGPGSLREALGAKETRTIVFEVSGTIYLQSSINVRNPNVTIAGQTAPGEGITIANYWLNYANMRNIIVRFIRFRPGDTSGRENQAAYGIYLDNGIFDHCTFSWATDEVATFYAVRNFTMQWSIISEALNQSIHSKGAHGYGSITGGKNVSWHHNLIAHATQRMTMFDHTGLYRSEQEVKDWRGVTDFRNNVIYNWQSRASSNGAEGTFNLINNYYKKGPAATGDRVNFILNPQRTGSGNTFSYGRFFVNGNILEGNNPVNVDNWTGVRLETTSLHNEFIGQVKVNTPFPVAADIYGFQESAQESYSKVLDFAGASLIRDAVDKRVVDETRKGTFTFTGSKGSINGIIDSQNDVGGWPELKSLPAPKDTDRDGMPDAWEIERGLNPNSYNPNGYNLDPNYTNLEVYLNSLVAHLIPGTGHTAVTGVSVTPTTLSLKMGESFNMVHQVLPTNASNKNVTWSSSQGTIASVSSSGVIQALAAGTSQIRVSTQDGDFSAICQLTVTPAAPEVPVLSSPVGGSNLAVGKTTFSWQPATNAERYRVQISRDAQFSSPTYDVLNLPATSVELDIKDAGSYFWRVSASNQSGSSAYSAPASFQAIAPPSVPQLVGPSNQSIDLGTSILLSWSAVNSATSYRLQIATARDFSAVLRDVSNITANQLQVSDLSEGITYFWRVRAINLAGSSSYSSVWEFSTKESIPAPTPPALSSPATGVTLALGKAVFTWQASPNATNYRIQLAKDAQFSSPTFDIANVATTSMELDIKDAGSYFWRVSASNEVGSSAFSAASSFQAVAVPPVPQLVAPNNQSIDLGTNILLSWSAVSGATSYRLQIATVRDFSTVLRDVSNITANQLQVNDLAEGVTYFWRVRASNIAGNSSYSSIWEFSTRKALSVPIAPVLSSPANSSTLPKMPVRLIWQAVANADSYQIQVSLSSNFSQQILLNQQGLLGTTFDFEDLAYNTVYFWRVRARNGAGFGPYSSIRSFRTEMEPQLAAATLRSPAKNSLEESNTLEFAWSKVPEASHYTLYISQDSLFQSSQSVYRNISDTTLRLADLEREKAYFWRIEANGTKKSSISVVWRFSIAQEKVPEVFQYRNIGINLYPNPAKDFVNLSFSEFVSGILQIQLLDSRGVTVLEAQFKDVGNSLQWDISASRLPTGKYILRIQGDWFVETKAVWVE